MEGRGPGATRIAVAATLAIASLLAGSTAGASAPSGPNGPGGPTTIVLDLVDPTRPTPAIGTDPGAPERVLTTTVYLPATPAPAPLVVLAHGFDGHPRKFRELATAWAAAGFVVAVPRFPVTADDAAATGPSVFVARLADLDQQTLDLTFVTDQVLAATAAATGELAGRVDPSHIGLFGLSFGSMTVWAALAGADDATTDPRIDAVIQSDGLGPALPWAGPLLIAHSDVDGVFDYAVTRRQVCASLGPVELLTLHGAVHATVAEDTVTPADDTYRDVTTAFWRRYLAGADEATPAGAADVPGVTTLETQAEVCPAPACLMRTCQASATRSSQVSPK